MEQYFYRVVLPGTIIDVETYDDAVSIMEDLGLNNCIIAPNTPCYYA